MVDVVIIGAGMSGLSMGVALQRAGRSFTILEKDAQLGGTWAANRYPGCACDIPSHLYGFSFAPNPGWSKVWADQPEILAYLHDTADRFGLRPHIRTETPALRADFDDAEDAWVVQTPSGAVRARYLVSATGGLRVPKYPAIPGREAFSGPSMHTARWDDRISLDGKRVGVIGAAASAVQLVSAVAERVGHLTVFQRTPNYVLHKHNRRYTRAEQWAMANLPGYCRAVRWRQYWSHELRFHLAFTPDRPSARLVEARLRRQIAQAVTDPALREKVMPAYRAGCKRILLDAGYYEALQRDNVSLVTDDITRIDAAGVETDAGRHDVDVLVYATGFDLWDQTWHATVTGRTGQTLSEAAGDAPEAWLGMAVPGFPNLFTLLGPNTGLGHNTVVFMAECQVDHIVRLLSAAEQAGRRRLEIRPEVMRRYTDDLHRRMQRRVWTRGQCASWYQHPDGKIRSLWPDSATAWWRTLRRVDLGDYLP